MTVFYELLFQILNTILYILIPIAIYRIIKNYKENRALLNKRIDALEKKVDDLESR